MTYYTHSSEPAIQAEKDWLAKTYKPKQKDWRIGQQAEYVRTWKMFEEGQTIIFIDQLEE